MRMILYLMVALIPIAIVYSRFLDGSKLKDFFLAVSYLSVMAWARSFWRMCTIEPLHTFIKNESKIRYYLI